MMTVRQRSISHLLILIVPSFPRLGVYHHQRKNFIRSFQYLTTTPSTLLLFEASDHVLAAPPLLVSREVIVDVQMSKNACWKFWQQHVDSPRNRRLIWSFDLIDLIFGNCVRITISVSFDLKNEMYYSSWNHQ